MIDQLIVNATEPARYIITFILSIIGIMCVLGVFTGRVSFTASNSFAAFIMLIFTAIVVYLIWI